MGVQEDLRRISEWSQRWEMPFNVNKCNILQVGTRNLKNEYEMNGTKLESAQYVQDAVSKANRMLGFINKNFSLKNKDLILPLYISLVRPHLEYAVQFWTPHHAKDIAKFKAVQ